LVYLFPPRSNFCTEYYKLVRYVTGFGWGMFACSESNMRTAKSTSRHITATLQYFVTEWMILGLFNSNTSYADWDKIGMMNSRKYSHK
jgi:hypothetical protein